jgi:glycosyltransferase involved in cell wall biosynthesis
MKILIISTTRGYAWGGAEEVWFQFAQLALAKNHSVMLAADWQVCNSSQVEQLQKKGLKISSRKAWRPTKWYLLKQRWKSDHSKAWEFAPDICLINAGSPLDLQFNPDLQIFLNRLACPKVFFCHFNSDRLDASRREAMAASLQNISKFLFVCDNNRKQLELQLATRIENALTIPNGSRLAVGNPLPFPNFGCVTFANVARLDVSWKGQDLLPSIFNLREWRGRDCVLDFFGQGPDEQHIKNLIKMFDVETSLRVAGYERDLLKIWTGRHLLLLPSRGEGMPLSIIEAMMCGRPVVATDVGGVSEIVEDGVTGFLAEAPTEKSFARAMERAWEARDRWETMGVAAHQRAKQFNGASPENRLLDALENVVVSIRSGKD